MNNINFNGLSLTPKYKILTSFYNELNKFYSPKPKYNLYLKTFDKSELQQIASNHLSDIDFKDFMKLYKGYTNKPHSFLVNDTTLPSDNTLWFRKNLL